MNKPNVGLLQATLDLLIRGTLELEAMHGHAVSSRIQQVSNNTLRFPEGSLYPALHRPECCGWIRAQGRALENNRRARYYRLTAPGRSQLAAETENWNRFAGAVARILQIA
jgi:transcriptional regulator